MDKFTPWFLSGLVIHGYGRGGTQLGCPTANIDLNDVVTEQLKPFNDTVLYGWGSVVAVPGNECCSGGPFPIAMSVGFNPHFQTKSLSAEVHFLHEFPEDFYGALVKVVALGVIRPQAAFTTLEALSDMIRSDLRYTLEAVKREEVLKYKTHPLISPDYRPEDKTIAHFEYLNDQGN